MNEVNKELEKENSDLQLNIIRKDIKDIIISVCFGSLFILLIIIVAYLL